VSRLLAPKEVAARLGVSRRALYRDMEFLSEPVELPSGVKGWAEETVEEAKRKRDEQARQYVTVAAFAEAVGRSVKTIHRWINSEVLPRPERIKFDFGRTLLAWPRRRVLVWITTMGG